MGKAEAMGVAAAADRAARVDLAAAFRLAVRMDLHEGVCNHFTLMLPDGKRFLLNPTACTGARSPPRTCSRSTRAARILEGEGEFEKTAFYIHSRIHLANPKAACVLHTHMPYTTALTLLENGRLEMVEQNALRFHDDIAYDDTYNGLVVDNAEGDRLARVLGSKRVLFLANHGVIVVGPSVAEAFDSLYYLERACRLQVLARSTGLPFRKVRSGSGARDLPHDRRRHPEVRRRALRGPQAHPRPRGARLLRAEPLEDQVAVGEQVVVRSTRSCRAGCAPSTPLIARRRHWRRPSPAWSAPYPGSSAREHEHEVGRVGHARHVTQPPAGRAGRAGRPQRPA